jgi:enoyl-CoA hydratase/carnithine racemase
MKEYKRNIARITINRPEAYNSFDKDTINAFQDAIKVNISNFKKKNISLIVS